MYKGLQDVITIFKEDMQKRYTFNKVYKHELLGKHILGQHKCYCCNVLSLEFVFYFDLHSHKNFIIIVMFLLFVKFRILLTSEVLSYDICFPKVQKCF